MPNESKTAYCSTRNQYFKNKLFFNENVAFFKKKTDSVKMKGFIVNNFVEKAIDREY